MHVSNDLNRLLNITDKLAQQKGDQYISSELFVLAAVEDKGTLGDILRKAGATKGALEQAIENMRGGQAVNDPNAEEQRQALEKYTIDLTEKAEQGKLDPLRPWRPVIPRCERSAAGAAAAHRTTRRRARRG